MSELKPCESEQTLTVHEYIVLECGGVVRALCEIVRCRDCKHYREHEWIIVTDVSDACLFFADGVKVEPDGFCKWGERRA